MMFFESLPEEILIIIIKNLDVTSVYNLYHASSHVKNIIQRFGIIKKCRLSLNTMASAKTMQSDFFKDISSCLLELDVCGMVNLSKSLMLPALKRLKRLRSLDVSYTNLTLIDFISMHRACPTIKKICIDFKFGNNIKLPRKMLLECQEVLKNMEYIHFFGGCGNLLFSTTVLFILSKVKLKTLQLTIFDSQGTVYENQCCTDIPNFNLLQMCLTYGRIYTEYGPMYNFTLINRLEFKNYEFIFIAKPKYENYLVHTSSLFIPFFNKNFNINPQCLNEFNILLPSNAGLYIWHKNSTTFDDVFFDNLFLKLRQFFPCYFNRLDNRSLLQNKWYNLYPKQQPTENDESIQTGLWKKRRVAPPAFILDYDEEFKEEREIELDIMFTDAIKTSVTLSSHSKYLNVITYLNLSGSVKYSIEFFNILFRCCKTLVTLTIEAPTTSSCAASISRSIPLSQTIKNICVTDKRIDFVALFSSFSQCKTLENIQLNDSSPDDITISDPTAMFKKCTNLYCLHIYYGLSLKSHAKHLHLLNKAKTNCNKPYINVNVQKFTEMCYSPFIDVYRICAIKPIVL